MNFSGIGIDELAIVSAYNRYNLSRFRAGKNRSNKKRIDPLVRKNRRKISKASRRINR